MQPVTANPDNTRAALQALIDASQVADTTLLANNFAISGTYTPTRTLNAATATLADIRAFVATLIADLQKGGENRTT